MAALLISGLVLGSALAADPGSQEDPLATVSFVTRRAQFTRLELAAGQLVKLGPGAELVIAQDTSSQVQFAGLDMLRDELADLTEGRRADDSALLPFHHYVNASAHELKIKPAQSTVLLLKGDWK